MPLCVSAEIRASDLSISDARHGMRELAKSLSRDQVENGNTLAGFVVFRCPLKEHSKDALEQILDSGHQVCSSCDLFRLTRHLIVVSNE